MQPLKRKIVEWDDISSDLGKRMSKFDNWLDKNSEDVTIFCTGIFDTDYKRFKDETKKKN